MMRSLGLCASLAVAGQAIMIPPNVALQGFSGKYAGHIETASTTMVVECPGCAFAQPSMDNNGLLWVQGVENRLFLNISVGTSPESLELNGVPFYPPVMSLETETPVPYIPQIPSTVSLVDIMSSPEKYTSKPLRLTSWSLRATSSHTLESGDEVLTIRLQLSGLERHPINTPDITIQALKNAEGQLTILRVETSEARNTSEQCSDWPLLCKWRAIIASKFHGFKGFKGMRPHGCHKGNATSKRPHHAINRPPPTNMHHGPESHHDGAGAMEEHRGSRHHGGPPHHGPGHHRGGHRGHGHWHHRHHKVHRFIHTIGRVLLTVLVPILLGVAAGMFTYALGMFIGATVALVWTKIRPTRQYQPIALGDEDVESPRSSMEKAEFSDEKVDIEAPPQYAEVEGKEVK